MRMQDTHCLHLLCCAYSYQLLLQTSTVTYVCCCCTGQIAAMHWQIYHYAYLLLTHLLQLISQRMWMQDIRIWVHEHRERAKKHHEDANDGIEQR